MIETNIPPHPALQYQGAHCLSFTSNEREELFQAAYFHVRLTLVSEQTCVSYVFLFASVQTKGKD